MKLLYNLEGLRLCLEVCARLCTTGESSASNRLLQTYLDHVCLAWESAVCQMATSASYSGQQKPEETLSNVYTYSYPVLCDF